MILDTNALSAIAEGEAAIEPILRGASEVAIPVIVLGEYLFGIRQSKRRLRYEAWLSSEVLPAYRLLYVDEQTAHHYAKIRQELKLSGRPIPSNDLWIAALARQHSQSLLSRDTHFDSVTDIRRIDW